MLQLRDLAHGGSYNVTREQESVGTHEPIEKHFFVT